ncbi:MAG: O-antigen ligase family protein [Gaiellaceae bacterium]
MSRADVAQVAALVGAAASAFLLLSARRAALCLGSALLLVAEGLLVYALVPADDLRLLVDSPLRIMVVAAAASAMVGAGFLLARFPAAIPLLLVVAAPFRIPVELGGQEAFLLVPLYAALGAAGSSLLIRSFRGEELTKLSPLLAWPVAAFVALSSASLLWSQDLRAGEIELLFFLFPFVVLLAVLARSALAAWTARALAASVVALALVFAGVGVWQLWSERLFFARDIEVANAYTSYFRTSSLFSDSSVYGRHLVVAIVVLLVALWLGRLPLLAGAALIAALWTGLYFSYSQSSLVALIVGALVVSLAAASRLERRVIVAAAGVFALVGAAFVGATARGDSIQRFTSGRSTLSELSVRVFLDHPAVGVGIGAQPEASRAQGGRPEAERNASHTTPLTVAAELGVLGLAVYGAFLLGATRLLAAVYRRDRALGLGLGGTFLVVFVHSLLYAGFFQEPIMWGVLAVAAAAVLPAAPVVAPSRPRSQEASALSFPGRVGATASRIRRPGQT